MKRGFTLIEILVSVALFTMVMVIALGALLSLSVAARKAENINSEVNNLSSAIESMTRTIRTGALYDCGSTLVTTTPVPTSCASGGTSITLAAADGSTVAYCLGSGASCNSGGATLLRRTKSATGVLSGWLALTAPEVQITNFKFYVLGACSLSGFTVGGAAACTPTDNQQARVAVLISGTIPTTANQKTEFHLQTSVTQRIYDQ